MSKMKVKLISHTPNPDKVVSMAAKLCYSKVGVDEIEKKLTDEQIEKFVNMLVNIGHESPLEHCSFTFAVEGISRACSMQLIRHRIASHCLAGDTVVFSDMKNRLVKKRTIEELYNLKPQYLKNMKLRCVDEENKIITENGIKSIIYSGEKEIFEVTTIDGYKIKSTLEHKFYTPNGWKRLRELSIRDEVYTNGVEIYKNKSWLETQYIENELTQQEIGEICGVTKHTIRKWINKFGLQKELGSWSKGKEPINKGKTKNNYNPMMKTSDKMKGNMNGNNGYRDKNSNWGGDDITESGHYNRIRRYFTKNNICKICGKKTDNTEVHHLDHNPKNSKQENLIELCRTCHKVIHKGAVVKHIKTSKIKSIKSLGIEKTYDIEMFSPHHNFIANGFVVHNSQQSQRYVNLNETFDYVTPNIIEVMDGYYETDQYSNEFDEDMKMIHNLYKKWQPKIQRFVEDTKYPTYGMTPEKVANENARVFLPNACETKLVFTMNGRSLLNFFEHRCCNRAQQEIRELANEMLIQVREVAPNLFKMAGASCEHGKCKEKGMSCGYPLTKVK